MTKEITERELEEIVDFDSMSFGEWRNFWNTIQERWEWPGLFRISGKNVIKISISTGGWSEHEEIMGAVLANRYIKAFFWQSSKRGGHYEFVMRRKSFSP